MPLIWKLLATVEEAWEINPPDKVARLVADKLPEVTRFDEKVPNPAEIPDRVDVPDISSLPNPCRLPVKIPKELYNPERVEVPAIPKVLASTPPVIVEVEVLVTIKLVMVVVPPDIVEEAFNTPLTKRFEETVEEALEIKPLDIVTIVVEA